MNMPTQDRLRIPLIALLLGGCALNQPDPDMLAPGDDAWDTGDPDSAGVVPDPEGSASGDKSSKPTYHLPFVSGETYKATTYSGHGYAWDFNLSDGDDCGEPVVAVTAGKVITMVDNIDYYKKKSFGNYVRLDHDGDNKRSLYGHLDEVFVKSGQWVERGQALGTIGKTGDATGCHIHLEIQDSSNNDIDSKYYYLSGSTKKSGTLSHGKSYMAYNHGKIESTRSSLGKKKIGTATQTTASRVASEGWVKYFTGGSYGNNAIYYQALGCNGGDQCPSYNNTNYAFNVRQGFYNYYWSCGGPKHCWLGFPTSNEYSHAGGSKQTFENGYLTWTSSGGVKSHK